MICEDGSALVNSAWMLQREYASVHGNELSQIISKSHRRVGPCLDDDETLHLTSSLVVGRGCELGHVPDTNVLYAAATEHCTNTSRMTSL